MLRTGTGHFDISPRCATNETLPDDSPSLHMNNRKRQFGPSVNSPKSGTAKAPNETEHKARIESLRKNFGQQCLQKVASKNEASKITGHKMAVSPESIAEKENPAEEKMDTNEGSLSGKKDDTATVEERIVADESKKKQQVAKIERKAENEIMETPYKVSSSSKPIAYCIQYLINCHQTS